MESFKKYLQLIYKYKYQITSIFVILVVIVSTILIHQYYNFWTFDKLDYNKTQIERLPKDLNTFSFAVMWDNRDGDWVLENIIKLNNKDKDILFDINWWDLVSDGFQKEFVDYLKLIKLSKKPFISIIWNHEYPWYDWEKNYKIMFWKTYFSFHIWNNDFIILDDSDEKWLDKIQFNWFLTELEKSKKYKNKFVFMHVPLYDPRKWYLKEWHSLKNLKQVKILNNLFDKYHITMVFASHIHFYYRWKWKKTPFIITWWAWAPLKKYKWHWFHNYIKVTIWKDTVNYKVMKVK